MTHIRFRRDIGRDIRERGFAWVPRAAWIVSPALQTHWTGLADDWNDLEPDRFLAAGARFRRRRYARFYWSPTSETLEALPHEPYFQPEDENAYAGGVLRQFAAILPASVANPWLHALVVATFACLPVQPPRLDSTWEVRIHQIRIVATAQEPGLPAPEGIHQDGTDFLSLHLVGRQNVRGGISTIHDLDRNPLQTYTLTEPLDSLILEDPRIMHSVTPVFSADGRNAGTRDLLGLDFIHSPELQRPARPL
jgi:hypothetical protein